MSKRNHNMLKAGAALGGVMMAGNVLTGCSADDASSKSPEVNPIVATAEQTPRGKVTEKIARRAADLTLDNIRSFAVDSRVNANGERQGWTYRSNQETTLVVEKDFVSQWPKKGKVGEVTDSEVDVTLLAPRIDGETYVEINARDSNLCIDTEGGIVQGKKRKELCPALPEADRFEEEVNITLRIDGEPDLSSVSALRGSLKGKAEVVKLGNSPIDQVSVGVLQAAVDEVAKP